MVKNLTANAGVAEDMGLMPGLRTSPGGGNGNPLQYSCLEVPFHSPRDLPNPGIKPMSPALAGRFFTTEPPVKPISFLS